MKFIAPLTLLILMFAECNVFKHRNREMFNQTFALSSRMVILLSALLLTIILGSQRDNLLSIFVFIVMVPLYILRRHAFINLYDPKRTNVSRSALLSDGIGLVIKWLFTVATASLLTGSLMMMYPAVISEFGEVVISAAFSSLVILIFIYYAARKISPDGFLKSVALVTQGRSKMRLFFVPMIVGLIFASLSAYLLINRTVQPDTPLSEAMQTTNSPSLILMFLFLGLCIAPFVEEVTFRGYFFHITEKIKGRVFAIIAVSLTFGILHVSQYWGDWLAIMIVCVLGFVLTFLRVWADSTVASVVTHYTYNIGVTIIPVILLVTLNPAYFDYQVNFDKYDDIKKELLLLENIEDSPKFYDAYNDLAWLYAEGDVKLEKALELINQALEARPENEAYLDTKQVVVEKIGTAY